MLLMLSQGDLRLFQHRPFLMIYSAGIHLFEGGQNWLIAVLALCHMGTAQAKNCHHCYTSDLNSALQAEFGCSNIKAATTVRATQAERYWLAI